MKKVLVKSLYAYNSLFEMKGVDDSVVMASALALLLSLAYTFQNNPVWLIGVLVTGLVVYDFFKRK